MDKILIYQLKVTILLATLFFFYRILLGKQTFHGFNRAMIILIAVLSFIVPVCQTGESVFVNNILDKTSSLFDFGIKTEVQYSDVENQSKNVFEPISIQGETSVVNTDVNTLEKTNQQSWFAQITNGSVIDLISFILFIVYVVGFIVMLINKILSVLSIGKVIREGQYADRKDECNVIESDLVSQPMNWMNYILMPRKWLYKENKDVWRHEMLHAHKSHSVDLLIIDIMSLFQWFNPFMYLLYKELELVHEYEADREVINSGADAKLYKHMLVNAVAENRGFTMANWLRQTNLKNRIDMMSKKHSNKWNRLRALFIPLFAVVFMVINTASTSAADKSFQWPAFQDGKTWIYKDGSAKVLTADGVEASMKATEIADYLDKYKGVKTVRMTLRYMYPIEDLAEVQPLAEQLVKKGIRINVANNDDILTQMTMPEYRLPAIYDLGGGKYRFEMNCFLKRDIHNSIKGIEPIVVVNSTVIQPDNLRYSVKLKNPTIEGDLSLMLKWINLFDGTGVAIYPDKMSTEDVDIIANAVWKRGLDQVSIVTDHTSKPYRLVTIIPQKGLSKEYPGLTAVQAARMMHDRQTSSYYGKGIHIANPKVFFDPEENLSDVINAEDELILIFKNRQQSYQWVMGYTDCEIEVDGVRYKQTKSEGMEGFESNYFWSPYFGEFYQTIHFPPVPKGTNTINLYDDNPSHTRKHIQITDDTSIFDNVKTNRIYAYTLLKTTHVNDNSVKDEFYVDRIDFTEKETTIYCYMYIRANHSFPGHVGNNFSLTLNDGEVLKPLRIEGVPVDKDFDRHGDWVATPFQVVFPAISEEKWSTEVSEPAPVLKGSVCHEPIELELHIYKN